MLTYEELKSKPRELLAATGLKADEFEALLKSFAESYAQAHRPDQTLEGQARQRGVGGGRKGKLARVEDQLLFILVYQKTYPLQTMLGLQFGLSQGSTNKWIHRLLPVLQQALQTMGHTPERDGSQLAEHELAQVGGPDLVIDGTERRRQRPLEAEAQRAQYSGKKNAHR
jgi:Helix-turn-helix of DDE superfamily endonuclease